MIGPGKYGKILTLAISEARAKNGMLIILDGVSGPGFSCQLEPKHIASIPELLRTIASEIEADLTRGKI